MKRDIKWPLPVRVRVRVTLLYQAFRPVFHFLTLSSLAFCSLLFCPLAFCPGFDLVYTAEIRGQLVFPYFNTHNLNTYLPKTKKMTDSVKTLVL